jgi:hypothetical protein
MYIQPQVDKEAPGILVPRDYSGNAFAPQVTSPPEAELDPPSVKEDTSPAPQDTPPPPPPAQESPLFAECENEVQDQGSVAAGAFSQGHRAHGHSDTPSHTSGIGGLLGRLPFLGSLLPPTHHCKDNETQGLLSHGGRDLLILGAIAYLLFFDQSEDSILPLLLLLLLWE